MAPGSATDVWGTTEVRALAEGFAGLRKQIRDRFHEGRQLAPGSSEAEMALDRYVAPKNAPQPLADVGGQKPKGLTDVAAPGAGALRRCA